MPLRTLTEIEQRRLKRLTAESIDVTLIEPTETGLKKSILDATSPVRNFLKSNDLHDYDFQRQGAKEHKVILDTKLISQNEVIESRASLYRPTTKSGDPRIWFSKLPEYSDANDMIAIATYEGSLFCLNLTKLDIEYILDHEKTGAAWDILSSISSKAHFVADELLERLRIIAQQGLTPSVMEKRADTAIGRTLESALGIEMNASREPDYKGIELKSYRRAPRASRENRKNLFAQVPNWKISKMKSSKEILDAFGYFRDEDFKLYCTVSAKTKNSQGLSFALDGNTGVLNEISDKREHGAFASWLLEDLKKALAKKHNETFWVSANVHEVDGRDHFEFRDVIHTRKPIASQFDILLEQGEITMDHLIKRTPSGGAKEKGPLFKINSTSLELLFPPSRTYELTS
ncbi:MAG: MvaI/BcnI family restriction endonuclease [Hyphomicrobiales bacterium]